MEIKEARLVGFFEGFPEWDLLPIFSTESGSHVIALNENGTICDFEEIQIDKSEITIVPRSLSSTFQIGGVYVSAYNISGKIEMIGGDAPKSVLDDIFMNNSIDPFLKLAIYDRMGIKDALQYTVILGQCFAVIKGKIPRHFKSLMKAMLSRRGMENLIEIFGIKSQAVDHDHLDISASSRPEPRDTYKINIEFTREVAETPKRVVQTALRNIPMISDQVARQSLLLELSSQLLELGRIDLGSDYSNLLFRYFKILKKEFSFFPINRIHKNIKFEEKFNSDRLFNASLHVFAYPKRRIEMQTVLLTELRNSTWSPYDSENKYYSNLLNILAKFVPRAVLKSELTVIFEEASKRGDVKLCKQIYKLIK